MHSSFEKQPQPGLLLLTTPQKRLLAIDPSLTASGWALFSVQGGELIAVGVIRPPGTSLPLPLRLDELQHSVAALYEELRIDAGDIVVCEGPAPLVRNPLSALKVEHVRSIFESVARARLASVPGRINPRTVQSELLGMRGKQIPRAEVKAWARETARRLFGEKLEKLAGAAFLAARRPLSQDIIDAALIGTLALTRVQMALRCGQDLYAVFVPSAPKNPRRGAGSSRRGGYAGWDEAALKNTPLKKQK